MANSESSYGKCWNSGAQQMNCSLFLLFWFSFIDTKCMFSRYSGVPAVSQVNILMEHLSAMCCTIVNNVFQM